jgi:hypothetical protein
VKDVQYSEYDRMVESRLIRVEDKLDGLLTLIQEGLVSQIKDHGKRIQALEGWRVWLVGVALGGSAVCSVVFAVGIHFLKASLK